MSKRHPFFGSYEGLAAATVATAVVVTATATAEDQDDDEDPQATVTAKTIITTHTKDLLICVQFILCELKICVTGKNF